MRPEVNGALREVSQQEQNRGDGQGGSSDASRDGHSVEERAEPASLPPAVQPTKFITRNGGVRGR